MIELSVLVALGAGLGLGGGLGGLLTRRRHLAELAERGRQSAALAAQQRASFDLRTRELSTLYEAQLAEAQQIRDLLEAELAGPSRDLGRRALRRLTDQLRGLGAVRDARVVDADGLDWTAGETPYEVALLAPKIGALHASPGFVRLVRLRRGDASVLTFRQLADRPSALFLAVSTISATAPDFLLHVAAGAPVLAPLADAADELLRDAGGLHGDLGARIRKQLRGAAARSRAAALQLVAGEEVVAAVESSLDPELVRVAKALLALGAAARRLGYGAGSQLDIETSSGTVSFAPVGGGSRFSLLAFTRGRATEPAELARVVGGLRQLVASVQTAPASKEKAA